MTGRSPAADETPVLVGVTVAGAVLLMVGTLLGLVRGLLGLAGPPGLPHPLLVAGILIAAGLLCGASVVALAALRARPVLPRAAALVSARHRGRRSARRR